MNSRSIKSTIFKLHRWIGIGLAPLFLIIALSGAVLALKPMQTPNTMLPVTSVSGQQLIELLDVIDPSGERVEATGIDPASGLINIRSSDPQIAGPYDPISSKRIDSPEQSPSFDLFEFAEHLHKDLLVGADLLIQVASYLMLILVAAAPFLAWPILRNNLMGWHRGLGWVLLPIVLMLPLTGILMSLHIGMPELPRMSQPDVRLSLQQALTLVDQSRGLDGLDGLDSVRRFRGGSVLVKMRDAHNESLLVVTDQSVTTIDPDSGLVKTLHEGTWAGPWSGAINLLGAVALSLLTLTGLFSWLRRRRKRAHLRDKRETLQATA